MASCAEDPAPLGADDVGTRIVAAMNDRFVSETTPESGHGRSESNEWTLLDASAEAAAAEDLAAAATRAKSGTTGSFLHNLEDSDASRDSLSDRCILESTYKEQSEHESVTNDAERALLDPESEIRRLKEELEKERALRIEAQRKESHYKKKFEESISAADFESEMGDLAEDLRISFTSFTIGDIGLFLVTPGNNYLAFNVGAPRHFLAPECSELVGKDQHFTPYYILGRITDIERRTAGPPEEPQSNPYHVPEGAEFSVIYLESITDELNEFRLE